MTARALRFLVFSSLPLLLAFCGGKAVVDGPPGSGGAGGTTASTTPSAISVAVTSGGADFASCSVPGTCVLATNTCCGVCGKPTLGDFDAVNQSQTTAHRAAVCPTPEGPCPGCATEPNPDLFAYCDVGAGTCRPANLPETEYAACMVDSDCTLRNGLGCCTCGDSSGWVAVTASRLGDLATVLCEPTEACPDCEPQPPVGVQASCVEGRCQALPVVPPG